jgi:multiple antibiotic resistance protein
MTFFLNVISYAFALFLLMDPLGNISLFVAILRKYPQALQRKIIKRELVIALSIIIFFFFLGDLLLNLIKVQQHAILIAGGIILFLIALKMIFPQSYSSNEELMQYPKEPFIVPLAVPFVAGPGVLAAVMLYSKQAESSLVVLIAIFLAWFFSALILLSSSFLQKLLGEKGLTACERLMGLLVTLLAVQMFLEGVASYVCDTHRSFLSQ